jgi:glycosyltransferase involved in cell wall biosynthesis
VIPTYNAAEHIDATFDNLFKCLGGDYYIVNEIIVIDGGSTDKTLEVIKKNFYRLNTLGIHTSLLFDKGKGLGYARSLGVKTSASEFILFIDSDTIISKKYIDHLAFLMLSDRNVAISRGLLLFSTNASFVTILENFSRCVCYFIYKKLSEVHIGAEGLFARREAILDIGNFNPYMRVSEDEDLAMRILSKGWKAIITSKVFYEPAKHTSSINSVFRWQFNYGFVAAMGEYLSHLKRFFVPQRALKKKLEQLALYFLISLVFTVKQKNPFYVASIPYFLFKNVAKVMGRLKFKFIIKSH